MMPETPAMQPMMPQQAQMPQQQTPLMQRLFGVPQMRQMDTPPQFPQVPNTAHFARQMSEPQSPLVPQRGLLSQILGQLPMAPQHIPTIPRRLIRNPFEHQDMSQFEDPHAHMNPMAFNGQESNDQLEQAAPMQQFDQMNNQQELVGMDNPMAEHMQFATNNNVQYY